MERKAMTIINRGINNFGRYYDSTTADCGLHVMIGKILIATELELITLYEMDKSVDQLFYEHKKLKILSEK